MGTASKCPNRNIVTLVEEDYDNPNGDEHVDEPIDEGRNSEGEVEIVQPDQGMSIVVQRALKSTCEVEEDNWVRNNVFHTKWLSSVLKEGYGHHR